MCLIENFISNMKINYMCKKFFLLCITFILFMDINCVFASSNTNCNAQIVENLKNYICMQQRSRAILYNMLDLSDEQIIRREQIATQFLSLYDEKFEQLLKEAKRLDSFEKVNVSILQIYCQKRLLEKYRNDIFKLLAKENRMFTKCLTKTQCKKYRQILTLLKVERKNISKGKNYYRSNPRMKAFGNPKPCSSSISCSE